MFRSLTSAAGGVGMAVQVSRNCTLHLNIFANQSLFRVSSVIEIHLPGAARARYVHFTYNLSSADALLEGILLRRLGSLGANPTVPARTHRPITVDLATSRCRLNTTTTREVRPTSSDGTQGKYSSITTGLQVRIPYFFDLESH